MANKNNTFPTYSNITIPAGGITYSTATSATTHPTWVVDSYYSKKPRVEITDQDIVLDGLSLRETMADVRRELMIPTRLNRNLELEKEFAELQAAADAYQKLELRFLEQKRMWETLKK